jgi:hypothetical protein
MYDIIYSEYINTQSRIRQCLTTSKRVAKIPIASDLRNFMIIIKEYA